ETGKEISYADDMDKFKAAYLALTSADNEEMVVLWEEDTLEHIQFSGGTLSLDLKESGIQSGSSSERLQILSLLKTMFQFSEVEKIHINNRDQDRYSGHLDISEAFTRDNLADL